MRNLGKLLFYENIFVERKKVMLYVLINGKYYSIWIGKLLIGINNVRGFLR